MINKYQFTWTIKGSRGIDVEREHIVYADTGFDALALLRVNGIVPEAGYQTEILEVDIKGYYFNVLRYANGQDCTFEGQSSKHDRIFIIAGEWSPGIMSHDGESPVMEIVNNVGTHLCVKSVHNFGGWAMMGGNFAYSCDSRCPEYPLGIHDRYEGKRPILNAHV